MIDTRPIHQRTDAELGLYLRSTFGTNDPWVVEVARRLERRMAADEMFEAEWLDVPAALRRQAV